MIFDPQKITNFKRNENELQILWLFGILVAGKNSTIAANALEKLLAKSGKQSPFAYLKSLENKGKLYDHLVDTKCGQYNRIHKAIVQSLELPLKSANLETLLGVHGVGNKSVRMFLVHSRPNQKVAVLDVHLLRHMREDLGIETPKNTPSKKMYIELEKKLLEVIEKSGKTFADYDLEVWKRYSNKK